MKTQPQASPRKDAKRLHVYNEGLCVYVWDAGHETLLREILGSGKFGAASAGQNFFANLSDPQFGEAAAAQGLAFAYELQQDDEVEVEVLVGQPLTAEQLADAHWMSPQSAWLHLPTGQLRVDTPNTMPLDPDPGADPGGVVELPPGYYEVRLYRVYWDAMHRDLDDESDDEEPDYSGPGEIILLTPLPTPPAKPPTAAILEFPLVDTDEHLSHRYSITADGFQAFVFSDFWWEPLYLSLDHSAIAQLGLASGGKFELQWEKPKLALTAMFLDQLYRLEECNGLWHPERFLREKLGEALIGEFAARHSEPAFAFWFWDQNTSEERLLIWRWNGKKAYPAKYHGLWVECSGRVITA